MFSEVMCMSVQSKIDGEFSVLVNNISKIALAIERKGVHSSGELSKYADEIDSIVVTNNTVVNTEIDESKKKEIIEEYVKNKLHYDSIDDLPNFYGVALRNYIRSGSIDNLYYGYGICPLDLPKKYIHKFKYKIEYRFTNSSDTNTTELLDFNEEDYYDDTRINVLLDLSLLNGKVLDNTYIKLYDVDGNYLNYSYSFGASTNYFNRVRFSGNNKTGDDYSNLLNIACYDKLYNHKSGESDVFYSGASGRRLKYMYQLSDDGKTLYDVWGYYIGGDGNSSYGFTDNSDYGISYHLDEVPSGVERIGIVQNNNSYASVLDYNKVKKIVDAGYKYVAVAIDNTFSMDAKENIDVYLIDGTKVTFNKGKWTYNIVEGTFSSYSS